MFYDLNYAEKLIAAKLKRKENARATSLFKLIRNDKRFEMFGDIPILSFVMKVSKSKGIRYSRLEIIRAANLSDEFKKLPKKEKTVILDHLVNMSLEQ